MAELEEIDAWLARVFRKKGPPSILGITAKSLLSEPLTPDVLGRYLLDIELGPADTRCDRPTGRVVDITTAL